MAAGTEAYILEAFLAHYAAFTTALPKAYPGVDFPGKNSDGTLKPKPQRYLSAEHFPSRTRTPFLDVGADKQHRGFFQVTVWWQQGDGHIAPMDEVSRLIDHFNEGTILSAGPVPVEITEEPSHLSADTIDGRVQIPVTIYYQSFNP